MLRIIECSGELQIGYFSLPSSKSGRKSFSDYSWRKPGRVPGGKSHKSGRASYIWVLLELLTLSLLATMPLAIHQSLGFPTLGLVPKVFFAYGFLLE